MTSRWLLNDLRLAVLELAFANLVKVVRRAKANGLHRRCLHGLAHAVLAHHLLLGRGRCLLLVRALLLVVVVAFDQTGQKD